ncbi:MAG TPA: BTAD domain-containing putative transcriptional regulator [Streptosporangiaceae bacterium]
MESQACLRVLGPVQVQDNEGWQTPPGAQLRLLMAFLALSPGRVVGAGDLVDLLWEERPPPSARASVQILVTRLRKTLAAVPDCVPERYGEGYRLRVRPGLVDVHAFRSLVSSARDADNSGAAIATFDQALRLWQGTALADVPDTARVDAIRAGLAAEHLSAVEDRFSCLLAAGRDSQAAEEIPLVLAGYPLAERLAGLLMIARYRGGRQADALKVFRSLRDRLAGELGVEPGPDLQNLHQRILSGDRALAGLPVRRWRFSGAPDAPGSDHAGSRVVMPRQLPAAPAHFVGRRQELALLTGWLDSGVASGESMTLAITGMAGVGKTALSLHWAHEVQARFPDGQLYLNLRGFDPLPAMTPGEAVGGLLESLGAGTSRAVARLDAQAGLYRSLLAGRRMLIVLDNARDETQVRPLLPGSSSCVVLVTSRNQLAGLVAAEGASPLMLDVLGGTEARQLLASRLGPDRVAAEAGEVTELTALCARLPLALAVTAARAALTPSFPLASLAAGLRDRRRRLDRLDAGEPTADVRAVLSWSYRLLSGPAARMFRLLGAHPGPDISAAAASSLAGVERPAARDALSELVRTSLLQEHAPGRFVLHDLVRAYAADLCSEADGRSGLSRVLDHYLDTAQAAAELAYPQAHGTAPLPKGREPAEQLASADEALAWLNAEYRVLLAAASAAAASGLDTHAWQLPAVLRSYFCRRGHYQDWAQCQQLALAATIRLGDHLAEAFTHQLLAEALLQLGSWTEAHDHMREALRLCRRLGDAGGQADCHFGIARVNELWKNHSRSLYHARRAISLYRTAGNLAGQASALNAAGWSHALLGNNQQALSCCGKALDMHRQAGDRFEEAITLDSLGYCCHQSGQLGQAAEYYQQALRAYTETADPYYRAQTLIHLGDTYVASGRPRAGRAVWQQALAILDDLHHPDARPVRAKLRAASA